MPNSCVCHFICICFPHEEENLNCGRSVKCREHHWLLTSEQRGWIRLFTFDPVRLLSASFFAPLVATLHVIGRQHAGLAGPLHGAVHPALVDGLSVDDDVAVPERDLVVVLSCVVIERPVNSLQRDSERLDTFQSQQVYITHNATRGYMECSTASQYFKLPVCLLWKTWTLAANRKSAAAGLTVEGT